MSKIEVTTNKGQKITNGESPNFQAFVKSLGIDKEEWLAEAAKSAPSIIEQAKARWLALMAYRSTIDIIKDTYSNDKRGITYAQMLMELDANIAHHIRMRQEDPTYSPISDKSYLDALKLKSQILDMLNKQKVDLGKLAVDVKKAGGEVVGSDIDWGKIDE